MTIPHTCPQKCPRRAGGSWELGPQRADTWTWDVRTNFTVPLVGGLLLVFCSALCWERPLESAPGPSEEDVLSGGFLTVMRVVVLSFGSHVFRK